MRYGIRAFIAINEPETCHKYTQGHVRVLEDFGITNVTTNNEDWKTNPKVHVIIASCEETGEIVGGVRLHEFADGSRLPIQDAISELDPRVDEELQKESTFRTGEACGLWNAKKVFGRGLSSILTRSVVAYSALAGLKSVFGLSAIYTLDMVKSKGFQILPRVGDQGSFQYPIPTHLATLTIVPDLNVLDGVTSDELSIIKRLRSEKNVELTETYFNREITVTYNLLG